MCPYLIHTSHITKLRIETKDIYSSSFLSLKIISTVLLGDADVDGYVQSIKLADAITEVPVFDTVTFKCNQGEDSNFDQTEYEKMLDTGNRDGVKSPILIEKSKLITRNCVFKNCRNSERGGVISLNYDSTYQDYGSTFAYNLADTGGAINVEKSKLPSTTPHSLKTMRLTQAQST